MRIRAEQHLLHQNRQLEQAIIKGALIRYGIRGQSLIVWAIAEGRSAAAGVDEYLMGSSDLPVPV